MTNLFDCSPVIAAKLARCQRIASEQRALTMAEAAERGAGWTSEDAAILMPRNVIGNRYGTHRNYRAHLNA